MTRGSALNDIEPVCSRKVIPGASITLMGCEKSQPISIYGFTHFMFSHKIPITGLIGLKLV